MNNRLAPPSFRVGILNYPLIIDHVRSILHMSSCVVSTQNMVSPLTERNNRKIRQFKLFAKYYATKTVYDQNTLHVAAACGKKNDAQHLHHLVLKEILSN